LEDRQRDQYISQLQQQAEQVYSQKRANPDYVRREPLMQNVARQVLPMIKPEHQNHPLLLELLDQATQGMDRKYYEQEAVKQSQTQVQQQVSQKRQAHSESSGGSQGFNDTVDSSTMPLDQLEKFLGFDNN
jgi:Zn-dependent M32 family carboxypeptidase